MTDFDEFVNTRGPALLRLAYLLTGDVPGRGSEDHLAHGAQAG